MGANVHFFPERNYGIVFKLINNFLNKYLKEYQKKHYEKITKQTGKISFDFLFVIRGFMINELFITSFKKKNQDAKTIMYQWDSNKNNEYSNIIAYFDKVYSFDYGDCERLDKVQYLPLFFSFDIERMRNIRTEIKYDFFYMGTYIPVRYNAAVSFLEYIKKTNYSVKIYIYIPVTSLIKELLKGNILDRNIVSIKHLNRQKYLNILSESKVIVDVSNIAQTGLAMRIIEALALNKKIMTTNKNIQKEPFYPHKNIFIFDMEKPGVTNEFMCEDSVFCANVLSLKKWIERLFEI
jgi:hypothetical protein